MVRIVLAAVLLAACSDPVGAPRALAGRYDYVARVEPGRFAPTGDEVTGQFLIRAGANAETWFDISSGAFGSAGGFVADADIRHRVASFAFGGTALGTAYIMHRGILSGRTIQGTWAWVEEWGFADTLYHGTFTATRR